MTKTKGSKKPYRLYFPFQLLYVFVPFYIYLVFKIAGLTYDEQTMGYGIFSIFLFGLLSSPFVYLVADACLYHYSGKKTFKEQLAEEIKTFRSSKDSQGKFRNDDKMDRFIIKNNLPARQSDPWHRQEYGPKKFNRSTQKIPGPKIKKTLWICFGLYLLWFLYLNRHTFLK